MFGGGFSGGPGWGGPGFGGPGFGGPGFGGPGFGGPGFGGHGWGGHGGHGGPGFGGRHKRVVVGTAALLLAGWVQQEAPETVNGMIEAWLQGKSVPYAPAAAPT